MVSVIIGIVLPITLCESSGHMNVIFWFQVRLRTEEGLLRTPSSTRPGFKLMTSGKSGS